MILVIKLSGKVLEQDKLRAQLCRQIAQLAQDDHQLVVVHGGGKQLTDWSKRLEIPIVQHQGRRVTDEATLELATMVFSAINRDLVAGLVAVGLSPIGISAFDGGLTSCRKTLKVLQGGVGEVQIVSGLKENALLDALEGRAGTMIRS